MQTCGGVCSICRKSYRPAQDLAFAHVEANDNDKNNKLSLIKTINSKLVMSEQNAIQTNTQMPATLATSPTALKETELTKNVHVIIAACSLGVIACFFLPWLGTFLGAASGYQLQQLSDVAKVLWFIPGMAGIALVAVTLKQSVSAASMVAGAMPFLALFFVVVDSGTGVFQALQAGAYITLILGATLLMAPRFMNK